MNRGMFVLVDSDVDEEELRSIAKKLKKMQKRRQSQKNGRTQSSSLSSSPTLSSPQDSDAASTSSVTSAAVSQHVQDKRIRKRKKTHQEGDTGGKMTKMSKKLLRELSSHMCDKSVDHYSGELPTSCLSVPEPAVVENRASYPSAWRQVNSSHYAFSSDDDSELDSRVTEQIVCGSLEQKDLSKNSAAPGNHSRRTSVSLCHSMHNDNHSCTSAQTLTRTETNSFGGRAPTSGERVSQLWCGSYTKHQKGLRQGTPKALSGGGAGSCLTKCKSCAAYSLPILSAADVCEMTNYVALDCEFVGVGPKNRSALGRCSIVDHRGAVLFDRFVRPAEPVTDYRTRWSGLRPRHLQHGIPFVVAQEQIAAVIKGKIVVGHAVHNDFRVIAVPHPVRNIRDTSACKLLREMADLPGNACALRKLTQVLLGRTIQTREHCSVTDARACMDLFRLVRTRWEPSLKAKLERRAARYTPGGVTDEAKESQQELNSFLDDQYWPADLFVDSY